jgi:ammonia channel protein AmtB
MKKSLMVLFIVLGVVFLALAVFYWVTPAGKLPHHFPGYIAGATKVHLKHGLAALIVAIAFGLLAWFSSKKTT